MSIDALPPLRDVIAEHGLAAKKSLGQNFILDLNLTSKIARAAGPPSPANPAVPSPATVAMMPSGVTRRIRCCPVSAT